MSRAESTLHGRMIFCVGARRSGTNWLQRTLAAHSVIVAIPSETYLFSRGIQPLRERFQHVAAGSARTGFTYMHRDTLLDALRDFCDIVFSGIAATLDPDARFILERTPEHVRCLDLIGEVYPDAAVVHIIRDGRDVARSLLSQEWGPATMEEAAEEWRASVEAGRASGRNLERYREVRYEELLADPVAGLTDLFSWFGLDATSEAVQAGLEEAGVRYNVDPSAPAVAAGKWRDTLTPDDVAVFERVAGETLSSLGYVPLGTAPEVPRRRPPRRPVTASVSLRSLRRRRSAFDKQALSRAEEVQRVAHRFLGLIAERRLDRLEEALHPSVYVRLVAPGSDWHARGAEARQRLFETLEKDEALAARQTRGDVHPGIPTFVFLGSYSDGTHSFDRGFALTVEGGLVTRVTYYRFPLAAR